jgi:hypothetical protein
LASSEQTTANIGKERRLVEYRQKSPSFFYGYILPKQDATVSSYDCHSYLRHVYDPAQDKRLKPKKPAKADEPLPAKDVAPEKPQAKINKYGFLHVNGKLAKHLGVEFGKNAADVPVRIEEVPNGLVVKILKA